MTDRHCAYTVVLDKDVREDDAEHIINAIMMIKGVIKVTPEVADVSLHVAEARVKSEIRSKLYDFAENL